MQALGADNSELKGHGVGLKGLRLRVGLKTSGLRLRLYGDLGTKNSYTLNPKPETLNSSFRFLLHYKNFFTSSGCSKCYDELSGSSLFELRAEG